MEVLLITIALLLALPLSLRWFVAWRMRQAQIVVRQGEDECRVLNAELQDILEQTNAVRQLERQYQARGVRLTESIATLRSELQDLGTKETRRMAA
jgi:DNA repair ATPase RecN